MLPEFSRLIKSCASPRYTREQYLQRYFELGLDVFPLVRVAYLGGKMINLGFPSDDPKKIGKQPPRDWPNIAGPVQSLDDPRFACNAWTPESPWVPCGFGIAQLPSHVITIDADDAEVGCNSLREIEKKLGPIDTLTDSVDDISIHKYLRIPAGENETSPLGIAKFYIGDKLEVLSQQRFVVGPGSPTRHGLMREAWDLSKDIIECPPDWWAFFKEKAKEQERSPKVYSLPPASSPTFTPPASIDDRLEAKIWKYLAKCDPSVTNHGGHAAFCHACKVIVHRLGFPPAAAMPYASQWNQLYASPPWSQADVARHVQSAYEKFGCAGDLMAKFVDQLAGVRDNPDGLETPLGLPPAGAQADDKPLDLSDLAAWADRPDAFEPPRVVPPPPPAKQKRRKPVRHRLTDEKIFDLHAWAIDKRPTSLYRWEPCGSAGKAVLHTREFQDALGHWQEKQRMIVIELRCNKPKCDDCQEMKRKHIWATVEAHTARLKLVYWCRIPADDLQAVGKHIRRRPGRYGWITQNNGMLLIWSDVKFRGSTKAKRTTFLEMLFFALFDIPRYCSKRYDATNGWALLDESKHECEALPEFDGPASNLHYFRAFLRNCGREPERRFGPSYTAKLFESYPTDKDQLINLKKRFDLEEAGPLDTPPKDFNIVFPSKARPDGGIKPFKVLLSGHEPSTDPSQGVRSTG